MYQSLRRLIFQVPLGKVSRRKVNRNRRSMRDAGNRVVTSAVGVFAGAGDRTATAGVRGFAGTLAGDRAGGRAGTGDFGDARADRLAAGWLAAGRLAGGGRGVSLTCLFWTGWDSGLGLLWAHPMVAALWVYGVFVPTTAKGIGILSLAWALRGPASRKRPSLLLKAWQHHVVGAAHADSRNWMHWGICGGDTWAALESQRHQSQTQSSPSSGHWWRGVLGSTRSTELQRFPSLLPFLSMSTVCSNRPNRGEVTGHRNWQLGFKHTERTRNHRHITASLPVALGPWGAF